MQKVVNEKAKYIIVGLLFLGWLLGNLDRYFINIAIVSITEEFQFNPATTGIILSSFFAGYALVQIPGGFLADKIGPRKIIIFSVCMWSIFTILTGAAWSFVSLIVIRFLFGLGEGGFFTSAAKAITLTVPKNETGKALSAVLSASNIMRILTPLLAVGLMTSIGWRYSFILIGIIGIILTVVFWFKFKIPNANQEVKQESAPKVSIGQLIKYPILWNLFFASFGLYFAMWGLASWMPTYLVKTRGLDLVSMGWATSIPGVAGMIGMLLGGWFIDKLKSGQDKIVAIICSGLSACFLYLLYTAPSVVLVVVYDSMTTFFISIVALLLPIMIIRNLPNQVVGTATGFISFAGQLAGFVAPMTIGAIVQAFSGSFHAGFSTMVVTLGICCLAFVTMRKPKVQLDINSGQLQQ